MREMRIHSNEISSINRPDLDYVWLWSQILTQFILEQQVQRFHFFCFLLIELIFQRKTFETTEIRFMNELHPDYLYWTDCIRLNLSFRGIFPLEQYKICILDEINREIHFWKVDSYRYYQFIGIEFDVFIGKLSVNLRFNNNLDWFRYRNEILCVSLFKCKILELMEWTIFNYNSRLECMKRLKYE